MNTIKFVFIALSIFTVCDTLFAQKASKKATRKYYPLAKAKSLKSSKVSHKKVSKGHGSSKVTVIHISTKAPGGSKGKGSKEDTSYHTSFSTKAPSEERFSPRAPRISPNVPVDGKGSTMTNGENEKGHSIAMDDDYEASDNTKWVKGVQGSLFNSSSNQLNRSINSFMTLVFFVAMFF